MANRRAASSCASPFRGPIARPHRVIDRLVGDISRCRLGEVVRELGQRQARHALRKRSRASATCRCNFTRRGELSSLSNVSRMSACMNSKRPLTSGDSMTSCARVASSSASSSAVLWQIDATSRRGVELSADDGRHAEHSIARLAQPRQPSADDLLDTL